MAIPTFPFEIARRDGRAIREIMCRSCAVWTAYDGTTWRHTDGTPACVQPEEVHTEQRATRRDQVQAEWRALQEWKAAGSQGEPPSTPTLTAIQTETFTAQGGTTMKATAAKSTRIPKSSEPLIFSINGKPVRENVNKFGELSWSGTRGIDPKRPRITPAELEAILTDEFKISNPRHSAWGPVTLKNGVTLQVTLAGGEIKPVEQSATVTDIATKTKPAPKSGVRTNYGKASVMGALPEQTSAVGNGYKRPSRSKAAIAERAANKTKKSAAK